MPAIATKMNNLSNELRGLCKEFDHFQEETAFKITADGHGCSG